MKNIKSNKQVVWGRKEYAEYIASLPKWAQEKLEDANESIKDLEFPEGWLEEAAAAAQHFPIRIDLSLESAADLQNTSQDQ